MRTTFHNYTRATLRQPVEQAPSYRRKRRMISSQLTQRAFTNLEVGGFVHQSFSLFRVSPPPPGSSLLPHSCRRVMVEPR